MPLFAGLFIAENSVQISYLKHLFSTLMGKKKKSKKETRKFYSFNYMLLNCDEPESRY